MLKGKLTSDVIKMIKECKSAEEVNKKLLQFEPGCTLTDAEELYKLIGVEGKNYEDILATCHMRFRDTEDSIL